MLDNTPSYAMYIDEDGNEYRLTQYPFKRGDRACVGCAFKFGNSLACRKAKTCTPRIGFGSDVTPLVKGHNVWILVK